MLNEIFKFYAKPNNVGGKTVEKYNPPYAETLLNNKKLTDQQRTILEEAQAREYEMEKQSSNVELDDWTEEPEFEKWNDSLSNQTSQKSNTTTVQKDQQQANQARSSPNTSFRENVDTKSIDFKRARAVFGDVPNQNKSTQSPSVNKLPKLLEPQSNELNLKPFTGRQNGLAGLKDLAVRYNKSDDNGSEPKPPEAKKWPPVQLPGRRIML